MDRDYCLASISFFLFLTSYSLIAYFFQPAVAIHDFHIFYEAAEKLLANGQLYERDLNLYFPAAPTYKFPPILGGILSKLIYSGLDKTQIKWLATLVHIICLPITTAFLLRSLDTETSTRKILFLSFIFSIASYGFILDNLSRLQPDAIISFALMTSIFFCSRNTYFAAGLIIGAATGIKIYPIFFAIIFIIPINRKALAGLAFGFISTCYLGLLLTNQSESIFFFSKILPILIDEPISHFHENVSTSFFIFSTLGNSEISLTAIRLLFLLPLISILILTANQRSKETEILLFALCCCTLVMFMHNVWWNYHIHLIIPCIIVSTLIFSKNYNTLKNIAITALIILYILSSFYLKHFEIIQIKNKPLSFILTITNHLIRCLWPLLLATICYLCIKKNQIQCKKTRDHAHDRRSAPR